MNIKNTNKLNKINIETAINEGLLDYKKGNTLGPFKNIKEFKSALRK